MSEPEAVASLNGIADVVSSLMAMWISVTFGYLTVSYFVGAALTRFQYTVVTTLYLMFATVFGASAVLYVHAWQLTNVRERTVFSEIPLSGNLPAYVGGTSVILVVGTTISIYFMYNLRKKAAEKT